MRYQIHLQQIKDSIVDSYQRTVWDAHFGYKFSKNSAWSKRK